MAKKLSKQKLTTLLKGILPKYGVNIYPALIPKIAKDLAEGYTKVTLTKDQHTDFVVFEQTLNQVRQEKNKFSNIKNISIGTAQHTAINKILPSVNRFCELYKHQIKSFGYREFIEIGLKLMGKNYNLNKFSYLEDQIFQYRDWQRQIEEDPKREDTYKLQEIWERLQEKEFGQSNSLSIQPTNLSQFINFVWAREQADENKATYKDWCQAQIEGLKWLGTITHLSVLHGEKALERYQKFMNGKPKKKVNKSLEAIKKWKNENNSKK